MNIKNNNQFFYITKYKYMNSDIILNLENLASFYKKDSKLKFKYNAINKALVHIKQYPYKITSGKYAKDNISNIGTGIANRIDEIIKTGTLSELPKLSNDKSLDALTELTSITGMGETRAKSLIKNGITSIDLYRKALKDNKIKSTHHIDIGLKYYEDLKLRIPRDEIEMMEKILKTELYQINPNMIFNICGSYRRGRKTCGDIDVLITLKDHTDNIKYLPKYVDRLTQIGFLIDHLTTKGEKKYMGVCRIDQIARRIDIRFVEYDAYYAALIYFTGSKNFNIQIRNKAIELGYSLNEYGLTEKKNNKLICLHSESEIFDLLKLEYVKPTDRDI